MGVVVDVKSNNELKKTAKNNCFFDGICLINQKNDNIISASKRGIKILIKSVLRHLKKRFRKNMTQILYVSSGKIPSDYIVELQKMYPDKQISVIIPLKDCNKTCNEALMTFSFYIKNDFYDAGVYKLPLRDDNINVYGIFSDYFSQMCDDSDLYKLEYMAAYVKCINSFINKSKFDIIHSDNIPLYLGEEFNKTYKVRSKCLQVFHHAEIFNEVEPFWAFINIADKSSVNKAFKDRYLLSNIANLFNLKKVKDINKCLDYFYNNYEKFRSEVSPDKDIVQNEIIENLNRRILKLFPGAKNKKSVMFNLQNISYLRSDFVVLNSFTKLNGENENLKYLQLGGPNLKKQIINTPFSSDNFRSLRFLNKLYLQKELSKYKIESKNTDYNLFTSDSIDISGYLSQNSGALLAFASFEKNSNESDYKSVIIPVLKAFEQNKNLQFILNIQSGSKNAYVKSLIEFFESQELLNCKWVFIDGQLNLPQFVAASDIILLPEKDSINREELLYTSLNHGCIPVAFGNKGSNCLVTNIFDDMNNGFGFKLSSVSAGSVTDCEDLLLKVLSFYTQNKPAWNSIIKNAMNYDTGWNFQRLNAFNSLYEELI